MASSVLPQGSGVGAYLKLSNKIEILRDNSDQDVVTRGVKGVARFISTYVLLAFFAKGGIIYNAASMAINAGLAVVNFDDTEKMTAHLKECGRSFAFGAVDLVTLFSYVIGVAAVVNAVYPDFTMRSYEHIENVISGKSPVIDN
jgi:hypothetical protein